MMKQRNHISDKQLSRYLDNELSASKKTMVEKHLKECKLCRNRLEQFRVLHTAIRQSPEPMMKNEQWNSIDREISAREKNKGFEKKYRRWLAVAVVLFMVGIGGWLLLGQPFRGPFGRCQQTEPAQSFSFDYGLYLSGLNEPARMQMFNKAYHRQKISLRRAIAELNLKTYSDTFVRLPQYFSLKAVYLLRSTCCKYIEATIQSNGEPITVFRQSKKSPAKFIGYRMKHARVDSIYCTLVEADNHKALTVDAEHAKYVIIGKRDNPMVANLAVHLSGRE